jgi:hypothetical protein
MQFTPHEKTTVNELAYSLGIIEAALEDFLIQQLPLIYILKNLGGGPLPF